MSWRDSLIWADASNKQRKMASFRGATFFVRDVDTSVGRRNVAHQYPQKDEPYIEDLGADIDEFVIDGYVIQNEDNDFDYFAQKDTLIDALKQPGSGTLIHPFYGEKNVSLVGKARISESFSPGGVARFRMTFAKVSDVFGYEAAPYPKTVTDYQNAVDEAVDNSFDDSSDGFGYIYDPTDMPSHVVESITSVLGSLNKMIKSVTRFVQGAGPAQVSRALDYLSEQYLGLDLDAINETCSFASGLIGMTNGLLSLVGMYGDLVISQLFGACSTMVRGFNTGPWSASKVATPETGYMSSSTSGPEKIDEDFGKTVVRSILELNRFGEETGGENPSFHGGIINAIPLNTVSRARQSANLIAIVNMIRNSAILNAARTAIRIDYTSYNSAAEIMNEIVDAIDDQLIKLGNDAADEGYDEFGITISDPYSFQALESLRPIFVESMKGIGAELAKIIDYQVPAGTISSLVVAYDRYENLDRELEIVKRNIPLVKHPGFLPGGKTIGILNE